MYRLNSEAKARRMEGRGEEKVGKGEVWKNEWRWLKRRVEKKPALKVRLS